MIVARLSRFALALLVAGVLAEPALAEDRVVKVDAKAQPWFVGVNPSFDFGHKDGSPPAMVWGLRLVPGTMVHFEASGGSSAFGPGGTVGPDGHPDFRIDDRSTEPGVVKPSFYFDKGTYPAYLNALTGAFVDADGVIVGQPFLIGSERSIVIPDGAQAISLGMNDDYFYDNVGSLTVTIRTIVGQVTVGGKE